jgi:hypothetical protein
MTVTHPIVQDFVAISCLEEILRENQFRLRYVRQRFVMKEETAQSP